MGYRITLIKYKKKSATDNRFTTLKIKIENDFIKAIEYDSFHPDNYLI